MYWQQWIYQQKRRNEGLQRLTKNCLVIISSQEMRKGKNRTKIILLLPKKKTSQNLIWPKYLNRPSYKIPAFTTLHSAANGRILSQAWFEISFAAWSPGSFSGLFDWCAPEELSGRWPHADRVQGVWGTRCSPNAIFLLCNNISYMTEIWPRGKSTFMRIFTWKIQWQI